MGVDAKGHLITAERKGARKAVTKKGLVVRYANPFVGGEDEILYESSKPLWSSAVGPDGSIHVLGGDHRHHTNETGRFTSHKVCEKQDEFHLARFSFIADHTFILGDRGLWHREGQGYRLTEFKRPGSLDGASWEDIYLTTNAGLFHHDADGWNVVDESLVYGTVTRFGDDWLTTASPSNPQTGIDKSSIVRLGDAARGFSTLVSAGAVEEGEDLGSPKLIQALGRVFLQGTRGVWQLEGDGLRRVFVATGWTGAVGNEGYLWIANGTELLCTNGDEWWHVSRILENA